MDVLEGSLASSQARPCETLQRGASLYDPMLKVVTCVPVIIRYRREG